MRRLSKRPVGFSAAGVLVILALSALGRMYPSPTPRGSNPQAALTSRAEAVLVPVRVSGRRGNFISGLTAGDFRVFENGQPQPIKFFLEQDSPVTLGLLVDHSGSMGAKLPEVAAAVSAFAHSSNPQDEMFVVDFADSVSIESPGGKPFTSDAAELQEAVTMVSAGGRTSLYDALAAGFARLRLGRWDRKALVVVSDGGDNASRRTFSQIQALARTSPAVIYSILLLSESGEEENPGVLKKLCRETGGIAFLPQKTEGVIHDTAQIAKDLRSQYTLGYVPSEQPIGAPYRRIEVKVHAPGHSRVQVQARPGYAPAEMTPPSRAGGAS